MRPDDEDEILRLLEEQGYYFHKEVPHLRGFTLCFWEKCFTEHRRIKVNFISNYFTNDFKMQIHKWWPLPNTINIPIHFTPGQHGEIVRVIILLIKQQIYPRSFVRDISPTFSGLVAEKIYNYLLEIPI